MIRRHQAVAALTATQNSAATATGERDQLRKDLAEARKQREEQFRMAVELTDALHQNANDLTTLATDKGQVPMNIGALLTFAPVADPAEVVRRLA